MRSISSNLSNSIQDFSTKRNQQNEKGSSRAEKVKQNKVKSTSINSTANSYLSSGIQIKESLRGKKVQVNKSQNKQDLLNQLSSTFDVDSIYRAQQSNFQLSKERGFHFPQILNKQKREQSDLTLEKVQQQSILTKIHPLSLNSSINVVKFEDIFNDKEESEDDTVLDKYGYDKLKRIEGQMKRYMHKIGLEKKKKGDQFQSEPYSTIQDYSPIKKSPSPTKKQGKILKTRIIRGYQDIESDQEEQEIQEQYKSVNKSDSLVKIMKNCGELSISLSILDKINEQKVKKSRKNFRYLTNKMKQLYHQNHSIIKEQDPIYLQYLNEFNDHRFLQSTPIRQLID